MWHTLSMSLVDSPNLVKYLSISRSQNVHLLVCLFSARSVCPLLLAFSSSHFCFLWARLSSCLNLLVACCLFFCLLWIPLLKGLLSWFVELAYMACDLPFFFFGGGGLIVWDCLSKCGLRARKAQDGLWRDGGLGGNAHQIYMALTCFSAGNLLKILPGLQK